MIDHLDFDQKKHPAHTNKDLEFTLVRNSEELDLSFFFIRQNQSQLGHFVYWFHQLPNPAISAQIKRSRNCLKPIHVNERTRSDRIDFDICHELSCQRHECVCELVIVWRTCLSLTQSNHIEHTQPQSSSILRLCSICIFNVLIRQQQKW